MQNRAEMTDYDEHDNIVQPIHNCNSERCCNI